jgi:hypothetical protein
MNAGQGALCFGSLALITAFAVWPLSTGQAACPERRDAMAADAQAVRATALRTVIASGFANWTRFAEILPTAAFSRMRRAPAKIANAPWHGKTEVNK